MFTLNWLGQCSLNRVDGPVTVFAGVLYLLLSYLTLIRNSLLGPQASALACGLS